MNFTTTKLFALMISLPTLWHPGFCHTISFEMTNETHMTITAACINAIFVWFSYQSSSFSLIVFLIVEIRTNLTFSGNFLFSPSDIKINSDNFHILHCTITFTVVRDTQELEMNNQTVVSLLLNGLFFIAWRIPMKRNKITTILSNVVLSVRMKPKLWLNWAVSSFWCFWLHSWYWSWYQKFHCMS